MRLEPSLHRSMRARPDPSEAMTAKAYWTVAPGRGEIRPTFLAAMTEDDVLVRTLYSGISRGTETLVFHGRIPASQIGAMRCPFQEGAIPEPVKYGYQAVGRIVHGPATMIGRVAFVLHPHQDMFVVPAAAVALLPEDVPAERAILAANMETALNALWDGDVRAGDRIAVIGAGVVGLLTAYLAARVPATDVTIIDIDRAKTRPATALGLRFSDRPEKEPPFDLVFHASGNPQGLVMALTLADQDATIVELSWYGETLVPLPLGESFHSGRLTVRSSQVGGIGHPKRHRWPHRRRLAAAVSLLNDDRLDHLISGESGFDDLPEVMAAIAAGHLPALCHRIRYST